MDINATVVNVGLTGGFWTKLMTTTINVNMAKLNRTNIAIMKGERLVEFVTIFMVYPNAELNSDRK